MRALSMIGAGLSLMIVSASLAQPVNFSFTGGMITGDGFPGPLVPSSSGVMNGSNGSGSGSTGGGIGMAVANANLLSTAINSSMRLTGQASHGDTQNGFTSAFSTQELILSLSDEAAFVVANTSTIGAVSILPVEFRAITGAITGDPTSAGTLTPGTYGIRFAVVAGNAEAFAFQNYPGYAGVPAGYYATGSLDWTLTLTAPAPGVAALFGIGAVAIVRRRR